MGAVNVQIKGALAEKARQKLLTQIRMINDQLGELLEAGAGESKSSAGDKYETQREMIKQSRDMLEVQLSRSQNMLKQLERISSQAMDSVQEGALMQLDIGCIWVSVPLGKLAHEGREYQLVSKDSPLFMALKDLKAGEGRLFRGKYLLVEELV